MENENTQSQTENENTQSHDETSVAGTTSENAAATTAQNDGKGKLWAEIGMGLIGGIGAIVLALLLSQLVYLLFPMPPNNGSHEPNWGFLAFGTPILALLSGIPLVAEGVRFAGKHTGGHAKRKVCYIYTAIAAVIAAIIYFAIFFYSFFYTEDIILILIGIPLVACLFLACSVIGYRKNAK